MIHTPSASLAVILYTLVPTTVDSGKLTLYGSSKKIGSFSFLDTVITTVAVATSRGTRLSYAPTRS